MQLILTAHFQLYLTPAKFAQYYFWMRMQNGILKRFIIKIITPESTLNVRGKGTRQKAPPYMRGKGTHTKKAPPNLKYKGTHTKIHPKMCQTKVLTPKCTPKCERQRDSTKKHPKM